MTFENLTDTSTAPSTDTQVSSDVSSADPSPAENGNQPEAKSFADVIGESLTAPDAAPADEPNPGSDIEAEEQPEPEGTELSEAEKDANVPFGQHPRWKEVLADRNQTRTERDEWRSKYETETSELKQQIASISPLADQHRQVQSFLENNGVSDVEAASALQIMASIKNNPMAALQELEPIYAELQRRTGNVLPADLQSQVDQGTMTETAALEVSRSRANGFHMRSQEEARARRAEAEQAEIARQEKDRQQREAEASIQQRTAAIGQTVTSVEQELRTKDPDFEKKLPFIQAELRAIASTRPNVTPQEAADITRQVHADVTKRLNAIAPKPQAVDPSPSNARSSTGMSTDPAMAKDFRSAVLGAIDG